MHSLIYGGFTKLVYPAFEHFYQGSRGVPNYSSQCSHSKNFFDKPNVPNIVINNHSDLYKVLKLYATRREVSPTRTITYMIA